MNRRVTRSWPGLFAVLVLLNACTTSFAPGELAVFNSGHVTVDQLDSELLRRASRGQPAANKSEDLQEVVAQMVFSEILLASPEREQLENSETFQAQLEATLVPLLAREWLRAHPPKPVTDSELQAEFERLKPQLMRPERRLLMNLFRRIPAGATTEQGAAICAHLAELRDQIQAGASFEALAQKYSDSSSAASGGAVGTIERGQLAQKFEAVIFALDRGELSDIIQDESGCHLFRVAQIQSELSPEFKTQGIALRRRMEERRRREQFDDELAALVARFDLTLPKPGTANVNATEPLFVLDQQSITGAQLATRMRLSALGPEAALHQLVGEAIFAKALSTDAPDRVQEIRNTEARSHLLAELRSKSLQRMAGKIDEATLRAHHAARKQRFTTEPMVELEVYRWPMPAANVPHFHEALLNLAKHLQQSPESSLPDTLQGLMDQAQRLEVPTQSMNSVIRTYPALSTPLMLRFEEGSVLGPFRWQSELVLTRVKTLIPARPYSFLEVRDRVLMNYLSSDFNAHRQRWEDELREANAIRINEEAFATFGADLLARVDAIAAKESSVASAQP